MSFNTFIENSRRFTEDDPAQLSKELNEMYDETAYAVNVRDIGIYDTTPTANGHLFFSSIPGQGRGGTRQVYEVDSILNGTTTIPTDPAIASSIVITRLYGMARNGTLDIPLPYVDATNPITLRKNGTDIELITGSATYTGYTAIIIVEYIE